MLLECLSSVWLKEREMVEKNIDIRVAVPCLGKERTGLSVG